MANFEGGGQAGIGRSADAERVEGTWGKTEALPEIRDSIARRKCRPDLRRHGRYCMMPDRMQ